MKYTVYYHHSSQPGRRLEFMAWASSVDAAQELLLNEFWDATILGIL